VDEQEAGFGEQSVNVDRDAAQVTESARRTRTRVLGSERAGRWPSPKGVSGARRRDLTEVRRKGGSLGGETQTEHPATGVPDEKPMEEESSGNLMATSDLGSVLSSEEDLEVE